MNLALLLEDKKEDFLYYLRENNLSKSTIFAYLSDISQFLAFLKQKKTFHFNIIYNYFSNLKKKHYSCSSIRRKLAAIKAFLIYFLFYSEDKDKYKALEPLLDLFPKVKVEDKLPSFLRQDEIEKLIDLCKKDTSKNCTRDLAIIELLYGTGIRVGELTQLNLKDIDLEEGVILISGKGKKERLLPLSSHAKAAIQNYLLSCGRNFTNKDSPLFLSKRNRRLSPADVRVMLNKYGKKLNIKLSPHTLRHSFATSLLEAGCDIRLLQEFLGHSSIDATQIYTHLSLIKLKEVYKKAFPRK